MAEQRPTTILIADDHPIFREGLRKLIEAEADFRVAGEAGDGEAALELARRLRPDVLLLDLAMPRRPGLEVLAELNVATPVRTIVLAASIDRGDMIKALQLGARGVVLKEAATQLLFKAIRTVMAGQYWVGRDIVSDLVETLARLQGAADAQRSTFGLTRRELQVVSLIVAGYSNKDIAQKLSVSEDTVKHHLTSVFNKTGVSTRLELALFAIHHQLTPRD